jgi:hypothetical protein
MSASIGDILTAAKNIVTAINSAAQTYLNVNGASVQDGVTSTAPALLKTGQGRIVTVSVVIPGTANGAIYDVAGVSLTAVSNQIGVIPAMIGPYVYNIPFSNGLVVSPGTGQTVTVSYS